MKGITGFALSSNRVTLLFLVLMGVAGIFSYLSYPKQEDPSIQIRDALVWAYFPGMPPQRVEDLGPRGTRLEVEGFPAFRLPLVGRHQVSNALAALAVARGFELDPELTVAALEHGDLERACAALKTNMLSAREPLLAWLRERESKREA